MDAIPSERFADLTDAALKVLAARAVRELEFSRDQQERALRDIVALRDEMIDRLRRRGDDEGGAGVREPRKPSPSGGTAAAQQQE
jgi:hypothetical protein